MCRCIQGAAPGSWGIADATRLLRYLPSPEDVMLVHTKLMRHQFQWQCMQWCAHTLSHAVDDMEAQAAALGAADVMTHYRTGPEGFT